MALKTKQQLKEETLRELEEEEKKLKEAEEKKQREGKEEASDIECLVLFCVIGKCSNVVRRQGEFAGQILLEVSLQGDTFLACSVIGNCVVRRTRIEFALKTHKNCLQFFVSLYDTFL